VGILKKLFGRRDINKISKECASLVNEISEKLTAHVRSDIDDAEIQKHKKDMEDPVVGFVVIQGLAHLRAHTIFIMLKIIVRKKLLSKSEFSEFLIGILRETKNNAPKINFDMLDTSFYNELEGALEDLMEADYEDKDYEYLLCSSLSKLFTGDQLLSKEIQKNIKGYTEYLCGCIIENFNVTFKNS
jgi:hypothetical protein